MPVLYLYNILFYKLIFWHVSCYTLIFSIGLIQFYVAYFSLARYLMFDTCLGKPDYKPMCEAWTLILYSTRMACDADLRGSIKVWAFPKGRPPDGAYYNPHITA